MGRIGEERFEMVFDREAYVSKEEAIRASREMRVDFIRGEAEDYLQGNKRGGLELFRVDSMEGWRTGAALGRTPESRVRKLFEEFGGEREAPPKSLSRARRRGIDR